MKIKIILVVALVDLGRLAMGVGHVVNPGAEQGVLPDSPTTK